MCIYCLEGLFIDELICGEFGSVYDGVLDPFSFQESKDVAECLKKFPRKTHVDLYIDVAFCRIWEKMILHGVNNYDEIVRYFNKDKVERFMRALRSEGFEINHRLGFDSWYSQANKLPLATASVETLTNQSRSFLELYYRSELCGSREARKIYKNIDTKLRKGDCYDLAMSAAYFSFLILSRYSPYDEILIKIATTNPLKMPDSFALDLWLQRKAFAHCLKNHGNDMFASGIVDCSMNAILYAIVKSQVVGNQFSQLDDIVKVHPHYDVFDAYRHKLAAIADRP